MMREIEGVTEEPRTRRRWFHDEFFDLFVWETETGDVTLFQLCYGTGKHEQALVWHRDAGLFHDGAEVRPDAAGSSPADPIITRFEAAAEALPRKVKRAVSQRVREYLTGGVRVPSRRKRFRREKWQEAKTTH
jgi:hypothetical protein